jgi:hypothetical protein
MWVGDGRWLVDAGSLDPRDPIGTTEMKHTRQVGAKAIEVLPFQNIQNSIHCTARLNSGSLSPFAKKSGRKEHQQI